MEILNKLKFKKLLNDNPTKKFVFLEWTPHVYTSNFHISSGDPKMPDFGATVFSGDPNDDLIFDYDWSINEYEDDNLFVVLFDDEVKNIASLFNEVTKEKVDTGNWTRCSDDLPDLDVDVLGTTKEHGDVVKVARWKTCLEKCGWEWVLTDDIESNSYKPDEIIAWMPLPEGYKEETNGN